MQIKTAAACCALAVAAACSAAPNALPNQTGDAGPRVASVADAATASPNVVVNGNFETGTLSGWRSVGTGTGAAKMTTAAYAGSYAMFVGTTKAPEISGRYGLEQTVTVPTSGTLTMDVRGESDDTATYANEEALLLDSSGAVKATCFKTLLDTTNWQSESCDVGAEAGQTLTLFIGVVGNGYSSTYVDAWYDNVSLTGAGGSPATASPTASASAIATASPKPTATPTKAPTPSPSPSATAKPSATPSAAPTGAYPVDPGPFSVVTESSFENVIAKGKNIRFSTYLLSPSSTLEQALVNAAKGGATLEVSLPSDSYVQSLGDVYQEDMESAQSIEAAGGTVMWDAGTQSPDNEPLHAKLAIVDGVAYLDGRNWDSSDVIVSETASADLTAIGNAIALTPTDSPYLDTVKQDALALETTFVNDTPGTTIDFMTESFGAGNVANALIARAKAGATVHAIVLSSDTSQTEDATLTQMQQAGIDVELNPASGSEKLTIIGNSAWFGSSNATAGSPYQIDWGAVFSSSSVLSTLQSNFNSVLSTCTKYAAS